MGPTRNAGSLLRPEAGVGVNGDFSSIYLYLSVYSGILASCSPLYVVIFGPFSVHTHHNIVDVEIGFFTQSG